MSEGLQSVAHEILEPTGFQPVVVQLHPRAQCILYDALAQISADHQVCVCTHSPYFFSATGTGTFLRLKKVPHDGQDSSPPVTDVLRVDLMQDLPKRDAFQIICYENNSAAFFCDRVVLVEGDSDVIFLKHIARLLNPEWDFDRRNVAMIRIGGKGNFRRYREFFESFDVDVRIIADLDAVVEHFHLLGAPAQCERPRELLLAAADEILRTMPTDAELDTDHCKSVAERRTFRDRYDKCKATAMRLASGEVLGADEIADFGRLFDDEANFFRCRVIANDASLYSKKGQCLAELRRHGINVLARGTIECYYPNAVGGHDKPGKALAACQTITARNAVLALCPSLPGPEATDKPELELIFENVFESL